MKLKMGKNNGGFSLIEVLAAISIMAIVIGPICAGMVVSARLNARCETLLQEQLAVKSAIETLLAEGVSAEYNEEGELVITNETETLGNVTVEFEPYSFDDEQQPAPTPSECEEQELPIAYNVTATSESGRVVVSTIIRAAPPAEGGDADA